jgi:hypothetical protein
LTSATSNNNGGGNPSGGTPAGATVTFTLTLASLNGNTESSVFNSLLIHRKGFEDGGSDKDKDALTVTQIPEPTSMFLLGAGLVVTAAGLRKRYRKK